MVSVINSWINLLNGLRSINKSVTNIEYPSHVKSWNFVISMSGYNWFGFVRFLFDHISWYCQMSLYKFGTYIEIPNAFSINYVIDYSSM